MNHILIITGGYLDLSFAAEFIKTLSYDKVFAVDKGLEYIHDLGLQPDYIVGDFDSVDEGIYHLYEAQTLMERCPFVLEKYPPMKDATDTELAVTKAIETGAERITVLGAFGSRKDHVLMNLGLLLKSSRADVEMFIVDENNRIRLLNSDVKKFCKIVKKEQYGTYLSVIPLSANVSGLTMQGVKYPLSNFSLIQGSSLTVSNEIIANEAKISLETGKIFIVESKD